MVDLPRLVKAILSRVREREGYTNKTKLVKYLYLFDLEYYRRTGQFFTGFSWRFHLYGPWTEDFEQLYRSPVDRGEIKVRPGNRADLDTEFLSTDEHVDFNDVVGDFALEFRRVVDQWADRRLGEMLDYVYFHTEPMEGATRGEPLDFSGVVRAPEVLPWRIDRPDQRAVGRLRQAIARGKAEQPPTPPAALTPPRYDEIYFDALRVMDQDEGY